MIDLHCHSSFSDGALSPADLVLKAHQASVRLLALTDHDTLAGLNSLHHAARVHDIMVINGIELSVRWKKYDLHLLGLNIRLEDESLAALIALQNESRVWRAEQIGQCLMTCGIPDAYRKACDIAGHERVARPHFAQLLINEGRARDMKKAFTHFLSRGRIAYVPTPWLSIEQAVGGIVAAGGDAVIAHPLKYALTRSKLHELINVFKQAGGTGMEVVSGECTTTQANELAGLCHRFGLLASSGSDYHSDAGSRIGLGLQRSLPVNCTPIWHQWNL